MFSCWIPVFNKPLSKEQQKLLIEELKRAKPQKVLITFDRVLSDDALLQKECESFQTIKELCETAGLSVGAWLCPTIGYGSVHAGDGDAAKNCRHIRMLRTGYDVPGAYCPADEEFVKEFIKTLGVIVKLGVKTILFEDDFTLMGGKSCHDLGCACAHHIQEYCQRIGEQLDRDQIAAHVFSGGQNRYRDAWIAMQKDTMLCFVQKLEQAVHSLDPEVRVGLSANASSFDMEGVPIYSLAQAISGKNRPLLRLTGAPYWRHAMSLAANIESTRVQTYWCPPEVELMSEGDTYPRPRSWVPGNYLEIFDMITRADGKCSMILKYMIDYNSNAKYETGYITRHLKNAPVYEEIERRFGGRRTVGIDHIFQDMSFKDRVFDEDLTPDQFPRSGYLPTGAQRFLAELSMPTVYNADTGASFAVDENVRYLTKKQMENGVITDIIGAKRLMAQGIDVGIQALEKVAQPRAEYFRMYDDYSLVSCPAGGVFYRVTPKPGVIIDSDFIASEHGGFAGVTPGISLADQPHFPSCYRYTNANGQKFMVYTFGIESIPSNSEWTPGITKNYYRQRQLAEGAAWLGQPLPAMSLGTPGLYILCRENEDSLSVGLWNIFPDEVIQPKIALSEEYSRIDCYHGFGRIDGKTVCLEQDIPPFGFTFFTVYRK